MESAEFITIQKYAALQRLSIHSVIKKTMNGELPTIVKEIDGKEVTYILTTPSDSKAAVKTPNSSTDSHEIDYKKEYETLHREHLLLKAQYELLVQAQLSN